MTQPKALYLADVLEHKATHEHGTMLEMSCAAELRRLSEIETLYLVAMRGRHAMSEELLAVTAQRDALLEALKDATKTIEHSAIFLQRLSEPAPPSRRQKESSDDQR